MSVGCLHSVRDEIPDSCQAILLDIRVASHPEIRIWLCNAARRQAVVSTDSVIG